MGNEKQAVKNIELIVVNTYRLHDEIYKPGHPLSIINTGNDKSSATISFNYDYEKLPKEEWLFHADASLQLIPYGNLMTRTTFSFTCKPSELFSIPVMSLIIKEALKTVTTTFVSFFSTESNFPAGNTIPFTKLMIAQFLPNVIDTYTNYRAKADIANYVLNTTPGLNLTTGGNTILIIKGTFMILDHILYENPAFNGEHNRNAMMNYVPLPIYETIKWKCIQIEKGKVQLTWMHTIAFFLLLDCALQLLLGEHANMLTPQIEQRGLVTLRQQEYIKFSSDMLRVLKKKMKEDGMNVTNLNEQIDWNSLMK